MSMDSSEVKSVFQASLLETIARRRSRRFPVGCTLKEGGLQFASKQPPLPLNDKELALLCWSGAGMTGAITGDLPGPLGGNLLATWQGKATPYACNVQNVKLFFTSDQGTFAYDPPPATMPVEIETEADREKILSAYQKGLTRVLKERAEFVPKALLRGMHWNTNQPGTIVFIPVVDMSAEYIDLLLGVFDVEGYGYQLFDNMKGQWAGLQSFIDAGKLKGPKVNLSSFELTQIGVNLSPAYMMLENMHLVAEALGLGSAVFGGYTGTVMLGVTSMSKGLGFRSVPDKTGRANPVGLDGVFQAYCPPYFKTMDDAVEAFVERKFGAGGTFAPDHKGVVPFKEWPKIQPDYHHPSRLSIEQVKAICRYVYETYGRFPATYDVMQVPVWLQVHHLEVEFYDKFYPKNMVTGAQRQHMKVWHKGK